MSLAPAELWPPVAEAVIFDFDGTLADTAALWYQVDSKFLAMRGFEHPDDYPERLAALGFKGGAQYTIERFGLDETVDAICDEWTRMSRELYQTSVTLRPGAEPYIQALKRMGIPCALATTNGEEVILSMEHVNARDLFDVRVYGADVAHAKDHPDIYLEAARRLDVAPQDCLVFEDIVPAILSAKKAGMVACGVRANDKLQPVERIRSVSDLWLDDWLDIAL